MDTIASMAASGLQSRTEALDILANNVANTSTPGYKADAESYNLYFGPDAWAGVGDGRPAAGEMPVVQKSWTNWSQGTLVDTGNSRDVALGSDGFFAVQGPGSTLYTRSGHLKTSQQGVLQTQEGFPVLDPAGKTITVDPSKPFQISPSGAISQNGTPAGQLQVASVDRSSLVRKRGDAYFNLAPNAKAGAVAAPEVVQGKVEASNVETSQSSIKIVTVMRQFEMLQRAVHISSDMDKQAVEQVARVSG
jgi:flagellar basal body rod protein FlgG